MSLYICPVSRTLKSLLKEGMSHFDVIRIFISLQTACWIYREWWTSKKQFVCSHHACILNSRSYTHMGLNVLVEKRFATLDQ